MTDPSSTLETPRDVADYADGQTAAEAWIAAGGDLWATVKKTQAYENGFGDRLAAERRKPTSEPSDVRFVNIDEMGTEYPYRSSDEALRMSARLPYAWKAIALEVKRP